MKGLNNTKKAICFMFILVFFIIIDLNSSFARDMTSKDLSTVIDDIKLWYKFGSIFCLIMALGCFIYNLIRLGASSTNTQVRSLAMRGLMISGAVAALIPVSGLFYGLIINFMTI